MLLYILLEIHCRKQAELFKAESQDVDIDAVNKVTAQDFEDAANEEYSKFKFGNLETGMNEKFISSNATLLVLRSHRQVLIFLMKYVLYKCSRTTSLLKE